MIRGLRMMNSGTLTQTVPSELISLLEKAAEFHGYLGPFLAIGVRLGLV